MLTITAALVEGTSCVTPGQSHHISHKAKPVVAFRETSPRVLLERTQEKTDNGKSSVACRLGLLDDFALGATLYEILIIDLEAKA